LAKNGSLAKPRPWDIPQNVDKEVDDDSTM